MSQTLVRVIYEAKLGLRVQIFWGKVFPARCEIAKWNAKKMTIVRQIQ